MPLTAKDRSPTGLVINSYFEKSLKSFDIPSGASVNTIVSATPLAQDARVIHVAVTTAGISGTPRIQIVNGPVTSANFISPPTDNDVVAPIGTRVFPSGGVTIDCNNYAGQTIWPVNWNTIYPKGSVLTVRAISASGHTATTVEVSLGMASLDPLPNQPQLHPLGPADL